MPITQPVQIGAQIIQDVVNRMSDPVIGFNVQLPLVISNVPRYTLNAAWLTNNPLVFPTDYGGSSPNVLLAPLPVDQWIETSPVPLFKALLTQIYIINAVNRQETKGLLFDGVVNVGIDCHISWPNSKTVYDFDAPLSAVEDTIFTIFNTDKAPYQFWSQGTIWNGKLSMPLRSALTAKDGSGFMQMTTFTLAFGLYLNPSRA